MRRSRWTFLLLIAVGSLGSPARAQHGVVLSGGGAVNRSMGGTATAAPLDSLGALFWNPATLSGLEQSELSIGAEALLVHPTVASSVRANAFGPGAPPVALAGSTNSDSAGALLPNIGLAHRLENSDITLGLGLLTVGGFSTNYPASLNNPVLTPQAPHGVGFGNVSAELQVFQLAPAASIQLTENLAVGFGPIVDLASLRVDPFIFAAPDDANGDGSPTYPAGGTHTHYNWGAGFQAGAYFTTERDWNFGASLKSPQWFERFTYNTVDELGRPRRATLRFQYPLIASLGVSYSGFERWLLASDVRYIDYRHASPFGDTGFSPRGAVNGGGWDSIFVLTAGAQYQVTERLAARMGYSFNTNPQAGDVALFNVGAPTILEHAVYTGFSWQFTSSLLASLSYAHGFRNSIEGPYIVPQGVVPGTSVKNSISADALTLGVTVRY